MKATENGRTYDVVIIGSMGVNPGFVLVNNKDSPGIADEYIRWIQGAALAAVRHSARIASGDVQPGGEVHRRLGTNPNPFIDPAGYKAELDTVEGRVQPDARRRSERER